MYVFEAPWGFPNVWSDKAMAATNSAATGVETLRECELASEPRLMRPMTSVMILLGSRVVG